ncbi:unnamed protein product [Prorocentrum cordatum]|uniref:Sugar phosphate transporter domain-containing protein n=1 Tax=Prorocentrum cordatum TaxID=2364126 RepID=A0ABN9XJ16_9DINO|nr:unnamed protein product [Polarella glacialis]
MCSGWRLSPARRWLLPLAAALLACPGSLAERTRATFHLEPSARQPPGAPPLPREGARAPGAAASALAAAPAGGAPPDASAPCAIGGMVCSGTGAVPAQLQRAAELSVPACALLLGSALLLLGRRMPGLVALYFGAQAGFSLYMRVVLSDAEISRALGMRGVPVAFLVTAMQQMVAFLVLAAAAAALWFTPWRYRFKSLETPREWAAVVCASAAFAANLGLNNLSLSYLPMSLNITIRSCLPLVTLALQLIISRCRLGGTPPVSWKDVGFMSLGVLCACLATLARGEGSGSPQEWGRLCFGVAACCLSCAAAAASLLLVAALGQKMDLNYVDSAFYMALPAALCLLPPAVLAPHLVNWPGFESVTDVQIFRVVLELSPGTLAWLVLSGVFALAYNVLQFQLVQDFSATHAALAGNFNKSATIILSVCFGMESLPQRPWDRVMLLALVVNVCAFTCYSRRCPGEHPSGGQEGGADAAELAARKAGGAPRALDGASQPTACAAPARVV